MPPLDVLAGSNCCYRSYFDSRGLGVFQGLLRNRAFPRHIPVIPVTRFHTPRCLTPGLLLWNSEGGKRSVGVQTFWFQAVCQNNIVWDALEVVEVNRKHTANIHDSLREIRGLIEGLVEKRDERRDGFVRVIRKAMETKLGEDTDEVMDVLNKRGITRNLAKEAVEVARQQGGLTIFAVVNALNRIAGRLKNGGDRTDADAKASSLLSLAASA